MQVLPTSRNLLLLSLEATSETLLGEVVLNSPLLGSGALGEGSGATEGTSQCAVLHADNADVAGATNGAGAGHASGHLDGDGEVHGLGSGETANAKAGDVLGDLSGLEGSGVGATGGRVNVGGERTGTVLVDLVEGHLDGSVILSGGETGGSSHTGGGLDGGLLGAGGGLDATIGTSGTDKVGAAGEGSLVDLTGSNDLRGVSGGAVHEGADHGRGIDWTTTVGAAKSGSLGGSELPVADDGGIGLRTAGGGRAVTRSAILNRESRQGHAVGTLYLCDDTVGEDIGGSECRDEDCTGVLHFECDVLYVWGGRKEVIILMRCIRSDRRY